MGHYIVQPNDTLSGIAQRHLGSVHRWGEIAKANHLHNVNHILIGQKLLLPDDANLLPPVAVTSITITARAHPAMPLHEKPTTVLPARAFMFVVADEINPFARKVVRKVLLPPKGVTDPALLKQIMHPEHYGFSPRDPLSPVSMGRHVGGRVDSRSSLLVTDPSDLHGLRAKGFGSILLKLSVPASWSMKPVQS